jgi:hypothetical protein
LADLNSSESPKKRVLIKLEEDEEEEIDDSEESFHLIKNNSL